MVGDNSGHSREEPAEADAQANTAEEGQEIATAPAALQRAAEANQHREKKHKTRKHEHPMQHSNHNIHAASAVQHKARHKDAKQPSSEVELLQARLKTYEQPFPLRKSHNSDAGSKGSKKQSQSHPHAEQGPAETAQGDNGTQKLSKAQRRNARRMRIRKEKGSAGVAKSQVGL